MPRGFTAAFGAAGPPDLSRLLLFLTRRDATVQLPKLALPRGRKRARVAVLILRLAREATQAARPTINPPIMSPRGVWDVRAIITYAA